MWAWPVRHRGIGERHGDGGPERGAQDLPAAALGLLAPGMCEEVRARPPIASAYVCAALGLVPTVRHADYAGAWIDLMGEDSRAIVRAASAASKAADYLLAFRDRQAGAARQEHGPRTLRETDGRM